MDSSSSPVTTAQPAITFASDNGSTGDTTTEAFRCSHYEEDYQPRLAGGIHFFIIYSIVGLVALLGNSAIVRIIVGGHVTINRRTFRYLTLLLCCYELIAAVLLFSLLFLHGIGYHNRVNNGTFISSSLTSEDENIYLYRSYSATKLLISLRDVCIGNEVSAYSLLALDRLLAIAAPVSKRWSVRLLHYITAGSLLVTAAAEFCVHIWLYASLASPGMTDERACGMLNIQRQINTLTKATLAAGYYALSLSCYIGTGLLMVKRGRSRTVSSYSSAAAYAEASRRQATMDQMARPLLSLVTGNAIQFVCLLPILLDNFGFVHLEITLYYLFFLNSAAVPCITVAFNKSIRDGVFSKKLCCRSDQCRCCG